MHLRFLHRILLLVSAGLVPLLLYGGWLAQVARERARVEALGETRAEVAHAAEGWATALYETRGLLAALAAGNAVRVGGPDCDARLQRAAASFSHIAAIAVVDADEQTTCASDPRVRPVVVQPDDVRQSALTAGRPILGWVASKEASGPALVAPLPGGPPGATLVAVLDGTRLSDTEAVNNLPKHTALLLSTSAGRIVASVGDLPVALGASLDTINIKTTYLQPEGFTTDAVPVAGLDRVVYVNPIKPAGLAPDAYVVVAVPSEAAEVAADTFRAQMVVSSWIAVFLMLAVVGLAAEWLLVRPMARLSALAARLRDDSRSASIPPVGAEPDEFTAVAGALQALHARIERGGRPYRQAVQIASEAVLVYTSAGRVVSANGAASRMLGLRQDQLLGASLHELVHGHTADHPEASCSLLAPMRHPNAAREGTDLFPRSREERAAVRWALSPIEDDDVVTGAVLVFSESPTAESSSRREGRSARLEALGELAGAVAHDFNNLLTAMIGYADLLSDQVTTESARRDVDEILSAAQRATSLSHQLLTLSRRRDDDRPCELNAIVEDMERLFARLIGDRIRLELHLDASIGRVRARAGQVEQLLLNLVVNARDAMPEGGRLEIRTRRFREEDGTAFAALVVADTGVGIPPELRTRLFEPYFTTKPEGTGLGLATVSRIVHDVAGRLEVESSPGSGSTFSIYLPIVEADSRSETTTPAPEDARGTETIVLVEDDAAVRALASRTLRGRGYEVREARDAWHALELLVVDGQPASLLLTDVVMPGLNGHELYATALDTLPTLRVLYVTGYDRGTMDAADTLLKPFTALTLASAVRSALDASPPPG